MVSLKTLDTIASVKDHAVFSLGVSQHMHKLLVFDTFVEHIVCALADGILKGFRPAVF